MWYQNNKNIKLVFLEIKSLNNTWRHIIKAIIDKRTEKVKLFQRHASILIIISDFNHRQQINRVNFDRLIKMPRDNIY